MTKTPTAEEVIELFQKKRLAEQQAWRANADDAVSCMREEVRTYEAFMEALAAYEQSQGPVTREWFVERFGTHNVKTRAGLGIKHSGSSVPWVYFTDIEGDTRFNQPIVNPTSADIETLVRVLGGTDAS